MKRCMDEYFRRWRYLVLFVALMALLVFQPILVGMGIGEPLFDVLLVCVVAVLVLALARERGWSVLAVVLGMPAAVLSIVGVFPWSTVPELSITASYAIGALFFTSVTGKLLHSVFTSERLSTDSIFGAVCGYLLVGVAWGLVYAILVAMDSQSFQVTDRLAAVLERPEHVRYVFMYYSFVTLATVGYGDITPVSIAARTLSWSEAIIGQLYLAILIAGLMGGLVAKQGSSTRDSVVPGCRDPKEPGSW